MHIHDCAQNSPEWHALRAGIPTASKFGTILAQGKDGGASKTRREYLLRLAGEVLTGEVSETYSNAHMERGHALEDDARTAYAFMMDAEPQTVGFITNGPKGCSPDSLVGEVGALEIKTALPHILIDKLLKEDFPPEHKAQTQGVLWIAERAWIDLAIYYPRLPLVVRRAYRDEAYIKKLSDAVAIFNDELAATVDHVRAYGGDVRLKDALYASLQETAPYGRDVSGRAMHPMEAI